MQHLILLDWSGSAGSASCGGALKSRSGVAGAVRIGPGLSPAGKVYPGRTLSLSGSCPSTPGGETPLVSLMVSVLAPQGSVSSLRAKSGVEGWGLGVQGCRTWHAWARGDQARHFSNGETKVQRGEETCQKSYRQFGELDQGPRYSDSHL